MYDADDIIRYKHAVIPGALIVAPSSTMYLVISRNDEEHCTVIFVPSPNLREAEIEINFGDPIEIDDLLLIGDRLISFYHYHDVSK